MNLIQELANKARTEVYQRIGYNDHDREIAFEQKFAELIIKECADISDASFHNGSAGYTAILKHFGVEE